MTAISVDPKQFLPPGTELVPTCQCAGPKAKWIRYMLPGGGDELRWGCATCGKQYVTRFTDAARKNADALLGRQRKPADTAVPTGAFDGSFERRLSDVERRIDALKTMQDDVDALRTWVSAQENQLQHLASTHARIEKRLDSLDRQHGAEHRQLEQRIREHDAGLTRIEQQCHARHLHPMFQTNPLVQSFSGLELLKERGGPIPAGGPVSDGDRLRLMTELRDRLSKKCARYEDSLRTLRDLLEEQEAVYHADAGVVPDNERLAHSVRKFFIDKLRGQFDLLDAQGVKP